MKALACLSRSHTFLLYFFLFLNFVIRKIDFNWNRYYLFLIVYFFLIVYINSIIHKMDNFNNVTNFRIVWISNYFISFYFFKIVTVHARYVSPQTISYDLFEAISRREGRETAFVCILNPLSFAIRSKKKTSRLRGTAMFADYPSAAKITVTCFARFLFVSIYFSPTVLCLHTLYAIYNIRRRKKETDTLLCFCRRDSDLSS